MKDLLAHVEGKAGLDSTGLLYRIQFLFSDTSCLLYSKSSFKGEKSLKVVLFFLNYHLCDGFLVLLTG